MKYKVNPDCRLYEQLMNLKTRIDKANRVARRIQKKLGAKGIAVTGGSLAGDIEGLKFDEKPQGFKAVGYKYQHFYMPLVTNKTAWKILKDLTVIENDELNKLLNFHPETLMKDDSFINLVRPGVGWRKNCILITIHEKMKYEPVEGMIEITVSEYQKLEAGK